MTVGINPQGKIEHGMFDCGLSGAYPVDKELLAEVLEEMGAIKWDEVSAWVIKPGFVDDKN